MNETQRVIKYVAIAFGIFLAINIVFAIAFGLFGLAKVTGIIEPDTLNYISDTYEINESINKLKVDLEISEFEIKSGENFKIEVTNVSDSFRFSTNNNILEIKDEEIRKGWFNLDIKSPKIVLYVPQDTIFEDVNIETGVGKAKIGEIQTGIFTLDLGIGTFFADKIIVTNSAEINGGVGKTEIKYGEFNNLNLETGVGECIINTKLTGNTKLECGIGRLEINLLDEMDKYRISTETGIGVVTINNQKVSNESIQGTGDTKIKVNGGIGSVEIRTKE